MVTWVFFFCRPPPPPSSTELVRAASVVLNAHAISPSCTLGRAASLCSKFGHLRHRRLSSTDGKIMASWEKELNRFLLEEEEEDDEFFSIIVPAVLSCLYEDKRPEHTSSLSGANKVEEILEGHENWCKAEFRMEPEVFRAVANLLREENFLRDTRGVKIEEQLGMFMFMLSHHASTERLKKEFQHSGETIHRKINEVFDIIPALSHRFVKLPNPNQTHVKIASNPRYMPFFQNCIGAIDGTHIPITITEDRAAPYRNRKGTLSQNVMCACDFDLNFTFISCGWEGSASDAGVLRSALRKGFHVPAGKFYLVDGGYANTPSFIAPYQGVRYHLTMSKSKDSNRAVWSFMYEKGLVDIMKDHVNIPMFKGQNGWTQEGWRSIAQKFNENFPLAQFSKQQIQEKERELKASYKVLRDAKNTSGAGWNESLGMLIAEPKIWEKMIEYDKRVSKFKKKSFPLYNDVASLHEGNVAIGDLNFTSTQEVPLLAPAIPSGRAPPSAPTGRAPPSAPAALAPPSAPATLAPPSAPVVPSAVSSSEQGLAPFDTSPFASDVQEISSAHKENVEGSGRRKRRQSHIGSVLEGYVEFRKDQTNKAMNAMDEKRRREEEYSVEKCLEELDAMDGLTDEDKAYGMNVFETEANREMFMKSKNHRARLIWLKRKITVIAGMI
ncbi:hypothetical protein U9M48_002267 [Paspalum notatum var. saurae]|uniref:Transposase n=1 Tax=Paspalum notatum var. saurae TaxID=547442 RepID=A0AAQ3PNM8_PASNO